MCRSSDFTCFCSVSPAVFSLFAVFLRLEGADDAPDDEVVEPFLVAGEVGGMESGRDYAEAVIYALAVAEEGVHGEPAGFHALPPLSVVAEHPHVMAHLFPYAEGDAVLDYEGERYELLGIEGQRHPLGLGLVEAEFALRVCHQQRSVHKVGIIHNLDVDVAVVDVPAVFAYFRCRFTLRRSRAECVSHVLQPVFDTAEFLLSECLHDFLFWHGGEGLHCVSESFEEETDDLALKPVLMLPAVCGAVLHGMADHIVGHHGYPCAAHLDRAAQEPVEVEELELALEGGVHGVDDGVAHLPQRPDGVELAGVLLALFVSDKAVVVAHGEVEMVGVHETRVHVGGGDERLAGPEGCLDDVAVCPCHGVSVSEIVAVVSPVCADGSGDGVGGKPVVRHYCRDILLSHFFYVVKGWMILEIVVFL